MSFKRYYLPLKGRVELPFLLAYRRTKVPVTLNDTSFYIRNSYSIRRFITTGNIVRNPVEEEEFEAKTTKRKRKKNVRINLDDFLKGSTITTSNESSEKVAVEETQTLLEDPQTIEESELDMPGTKLLRLVREYQLNNPQYVLLTRVGDFYELYYEQADEIGPLLDITVIDRQFKKQKVKFTGFPARHLEKYLEMLVSKLGKSVAMCEQFQDPVTKYYSRRVSRIITPGTLINEQFLDPCEHNYLLSVEGDADSNSIGLAWVDLSTGDFMVEESSPKSFLSDLARIQPREIVLNESLKAETHPMHQLIQKTANYLTTYEPSDTFTPDFQSKFLTNINSQDKKNRIDENSTAQDSFAAKLSDLELRASSGLLSYLDRILIDRKVSLQSPIKYVPETIMKINQIAFSSLELLRSLKGNTKKGSLLHSIDFTTTKAGSRLLAERLTSPLTSIDKINKRLDLVQLFYDNSHLTSDIQSNLANCRDAQRALQRLSLNYGGPADLVDISTTLKTICKIKELLVKSSPEYFASNFSGFLDDLQPHEDLADTIIEAMGIEAPKRLSGPGFINKRSTRRLKELSNEYDKLISEKEELEQELRQLYDIKSLKLLSTASLKHYVEVSPRDAAKVMESEDVTLIQTLKGKRRFQINRWTILSSKLEFTYEQIYEEEKAVFEETVNKVLVKTPSIMKSCRVLAQLDVASSFAVLAREKNYSRPILNDSGETKIIGGRHPVVEKSLHDKGRQFAKNDCLVGANGNVWLITGPNMGGKSTFLRQVAIVSIMAQTGGFVPADRAELGIIDGLFSRVGAADNLALDQSTFMVEMMETATILNNATSKSLVIMDEVGRGTSTTDGLSIAYATLHHLNQTIKCRSLFATHYHELTDMLNEELQDVACYHTTVQEDQAGNYSYVHVVRPGVMRQSHGLYVAQLAGLPRSVIELARHVKENLDTKPMPKPSVAYIPPPVPQPVDNTSSIKLSKIQRLFQDVDIMETTPGKALDLISKACKVLNTNTTHP